MNHDSSTMKTKIRRLEEDNLKKEKEMESLLNPGKSEEIRRTIGDRKPDSGAVIHSLKQKILKLEVQLRDRESAYNKLQAELKVTKVEEMKVQMEALYQEIVRLQNIKSASSTKVGSENSVRVKALNETILRLSRSNEALQQENRSLKEDLEKAIEGSNLKPDLDRDYDDMNRRELLMTISNLEKRVNKGERYETDSTGSLDKDVSRSKLVLKGSLEERLSQLDHRETELLDEVQRLKLTIKRLREERSSRKLDERESLPPTPTPRRRASRDVGSAGSSRRPSSASRPYSARRDSMMSEDRAQNVNEFKQRHAATSIQRQWRNRKQQQEQDEKVQHFRENRAAKKIQNEWIGYQHRKHDGDVDDAAYTIQAALNGHRSRKKQLRHLADDDSSTATEDDDDVFLIQSSLKGHHARVEQMKRLRSQRYDSYEDEDEYYDTKSSGQSRRSSVQRPSSGKGQRRKASTPSVHRFKPKYGSGLIGETNGDDDDEDIMF
ncbi:hypothetical protein V1264_011627 [Littorina saxatilis]